VHVSFNAFKHPKVLIVQALLIGYGVLATHMRVRRALIFIIGIGDG
jgi:hypothetical protein